MARQEHDREDLLAEATALARRIELRIPAWQDPIVLGIRSTGDLSVYLGAEPAYHFNQQGELRRAYWAGRLFKAEARRLVSLTRHRTTEAVELQRHDLSPDETQAFLVDLEQQLDAVRAALANDQAEELRQHPPGASLLKTAEGWLAALPRPIVVAERPHAG